MQMCRAFPEACVFKLCVQNASLSRFGTSFSADSAWGNLGFPAMAKQERRLFGPCGGAVCLEVLVPADMDVSSEEESDHAARLARRAAKQKKKFKHFFSGLYQTS